MRLGRSSARGARAPEVPNADEPRSREHLRVDNRLSHLELHVLRRLDGLLQGDYRGLVVGSGTEPAESRPYHVGDDLRRMDWRLTARTTQPYVRDTVADRELELWVLVDDSPSLRFGTDRYLKWDLALGAVASVALLTARAGNRVGAVLFGGGPVKVFPAQVGRDNAMQLLARLDRTARIGAAQGEPSSLEEAVQSVSRLARQRGMVAVVSDFLFTGEWEQALRGLHSRHDVLAFELVDPRELELPPVGLLTLVDPETGRSHHVQTSSSRVRERYAALATDQRAVIRASLKKAGADHVTLRTDKDWVIEIARFVERRRRLVKHGVHQLSEAAS